MSDERKANFFELMTDESALITDLLGSLDVAPFGRRDADAVALVYERRNGDCDAVFELRGLVDVRDGRALHRRLGLDDGQLYRRRKVNADWRAFVELRLN